MTITKFAKFLKRNKKTTFSSHSGSACPLATALKSNHCCGMDDCYQNAARKKWQKKFIMHVDSSFAGLDVTGAEALQVLRTVTRRSL